jgi:hypothetical protein
MKVNNRDECKALYELTDEQINYLLKASWDFIRGLKSTGVPPSQNFDITPIVDVIDRESLAVEKSMSGNMVDAMLDYILPNMWSAITRRS